MPSQAGSLELIARELARALEPLKDRLAANNARAFLAEIGLRLPPSLASQGQVAASIGGTAAAAAGLAPVIVQLTNAIAADNPAQIASAGASLLGKVIDLINGLSQMGTALDAAAAGAGGLTPAERAEIQNFAQQLPGRLFDYAFVEYLRGRGEGVVSTLALTGIIDDESDPGDPANPLKPPYRKRAIHLDRVFDIFLKPDRYLKNAFGWAEPGFNGLQFFPKVANFLESADLPANLILPPGQPPILEAFLFRLSTDPATNPPTLTVRVRIPATQDFNRTYNINSLWDVVISAAARFEAGIEGRVKPPLDVSITPPAGTISLALRAGFATRRETIILGETGKSRIAAQKLAFFAGLKGAFANGVFTGEPTLDTEIAGGKIVIDLSSGDGFIKTVTGGFKIEADLGFKLHWSPSSGLSIEGSAAVEIALPVHVTLGPLGIETIYLRSGLAPDGSLPTELSGAFSVNLGPLKASVDRIGAIVRTTFPAKGGNLGKANLAFEFKPPNGVGLVVDAGVIKGGGFLYIDAERGEYAGALELLFSGFIALKAIGIINTRMPDGSEGFSLLIIITVEFGTGIQLGFGFTLLAVGGLIGLNRTMLLRPLMEGVRTGAINSLMFPKDVVANAPRIISDLKAIFPPENGKFLIGPMAKLGWGTPTLVSLALGIIIEIPGNIAIVGVLRLALPVDDLALIVIQVNFAGAIEFDKKRVYFFAALFESRILFITIEGEMGLLAAFGDDANFVLSVGGFHSRYDPPPLPFPIPRRIAVSILNESFARIRIEGYFALTSNSVQFGVKAEAFFGFDDFNVSGHLRFEALFRFSPFFFIIEFSAGFSIKVFGMGLWGISVSGALEGPSPWRIDGRATLEILFIEISVHIEVTWGDKKDTTLPPVAVRKLLLDEFGKPEAWRAQLPKGNNLLVSLRKLEAAEADFVLHPLGVLRVSQRGVPLDLPLDKVGQQKPSDGKQFTLSVVSGGLAEVGDVDELFAAAQYQNLSDDEKLSRPAYQRFHGGVDLSVAGAQYASATAIRRDMRFELQTIDGDHRPKRRRYAVGASFFQHLLQGSAVALNVFSQAQRSKLQPFKDKVSVREEAYTVAFTANNQAMSSSASFQSEALARDFMNGQLSSDPALKGKLHVIPAYEVTA